MGGKKEEARPFLTASTKRRDWGGRERAGHGDNFRSSSNSWAFPAFKRLGATAYAMQYRRAQVPRAGLVEGCFVVFSISRIMSTSFCLACLDERVAFTFACDLGMAVSVGEWVGAHKLAQASSPVKQENHLNSINPPKQGQRPKPLEPLQHGSHALPARAKRPQKLSDANLLT